MPKSGRIVQAVTGESDINSAYPAKGPQRDFKTFGASFEIVGFAKHKQASPTDNPLNTTVDQQKPVKPRASSSSSKTNSSVKEPLDSSVPYAIPQKKKNKSKKSPKELQGTTTSEPPLKCTLEDSSPDHEEPMPGDLDLDDPCSLPPSERPPDVPLPMAMTVSKQTKPNNHHGHPHDKPNEGPRFFYIPDNRERCGSDRAKIPSVLPPTDRKGQPCSGNTHDEIVRPESQESTGVPRPESLRSPGKLKTLTREPEVPPNQWSRRGLQFDNSSLPDINCVSCIV